MAEKKIFTYLFILTVAVRIEAQFFDIFSDLRPYTYQTVKPFFQFQDSTTKKTKTTYQRYNGEPTSSYSGERDGNRQITREKARRKTTTTTALYDVQFQSTQKPRRLKNATRNDYSNTNSDNNNYGNNNYDYNRRPWQEANVIDYTVRPFETTRSNKYTTYNPLYNRPGVKPALVDNNRPPITNRPATQRPLAVYPRPTDASVIRFPDGPDTSPPVLTGPDVDSMSATERRRYRQVAEKMCDKYKSLSIKKLEFIPLLPSPETIQINVTDCEVSSVPLVVGGKLASIREFPHMALLGWTRLKGGGYSWKCGGSLVSDQYVLTAAHCTFQNRDMDVASGAPRVVQLGSTYLDDTGALVVKVSSVIRHPKYTQSRSYYDIALLKIAKPVTFSAVVKPACLGEPPPVGEKVIATGWGRTEFGGDQSEELRSVSVPIWDMRDCHRVLGVSRKMPNGPVADTQICAGERNGGKDTCQGDSGGPIQIQEGCQWRIVGVTSVGRSCGAINTPAVYAKVLTEFIAAQIFKDQVTHSSGSNYENTASNSHNSGSNNKNTANNQHSGPTNQDYGTNEHNYGSNNQNFGSNNRHNYDSQSYGSNFDNGRQNFGSNNDNNRRNNGNNGHTYDNRQGNLYNNANNRQGSNYDSNQHNSGNIRNNDNIYENRRNQESGDRYNSYQNRNVNNHNQQNGNRDNNYDSNRNNNGMINFDNHNSFSTNKPSTSNHFGQNYDNPKNIFGKRESFKAAEDEDIIYWPEA